MPNLKDLLHELPGGNPDTGPALKSDIRTIIDDQRQADRMPPGYKILDPASFGFDPRLAYELALELEDAGDVFDRYGYDRDAAVELLGNVLFIRTVKDYKAQVQESGVSFKLKAKIQAEDLLSHSYQIATDPNMPASVRADLIKWTAAVAELGPKKDSAGGPGGGSALTLAITFAGDQPPSTMVIGQPEREVIEHGS